MIKLMLGDCLTRMADIEPNSIDTIICDMPYGTTNCGWDQVIDLTKMWIMIKRLIKPQTPIIFTASQPFTSVLGASNLEWLKYGLIWEKNRPTGHVHAKNKPMKKHEDILVFSPGTTVHRTQSRNRMTYNPQGLTPIPGDKMRVRTDRGDNTVMGARDSHKPTPREFEGYPNTIIQFDSIQGNDRSHPTQKPLDLMEYLVKTYSDPGSMVLDFTMGSGTTGVACKNLGRSFIGIERSKVYYGMAKKRIRSINSIDPVTPRVV